MAVKMETKHPLDGSFDNEFQRSVITAELWRPEVEDVGKI